MSTPVPMQAGSDPAEFAPVPMQQVTIPTPPPTAAVASANVPASVDTTVQTAVQSASAAIPASVRRWLYPITGVLSAAAVAYVTIPAPLTWHDAAGLLAVALIGLHTGTAVSNVGK